jgi:CRISPR system Cascade subunit CasB
MSSDAAAADETPAQERHASLAPHDEFVARVRADCRLPGVQQALRRGLAKKVEEVPARTHAALLRHGLIPYEAKNRRPYYAVAALIADRPRARLEAETETAEPAAEAESASPPVGGGPWGTNLGESLALAVARIGGDGIKEDGAESRLHLMVRQDEDGLHRMLPAVARLLGSAGVPIDYACLLNDLLAWRYRRDAVATRWLESYYRTLRRQEQAKNAPAGTSAK